MQSGLKQKSVSTCVALLMFVLSPSLASAVAIPFVVEAFANSSSGTGVGLDTGISFNVGDPFTVSVDPGDLWSAGPLPRWSNAGGLTGPLFATGNDDSGEAAGTQIGANFGTHSQGNLSAPFGALVGRIGAGDFFVLGTSFAGTAPAAGNLLLYYWDSNNFDNTEFLTAFVDPAPGAPTTEPGTLALLGMGLAAIARWRRRS
ncbi:MAG: PEP-CTERM sorting domain-containing protein [Vicinamibacteria bacterium]